MDKLFSFLADHPDVESVIAECDPLDPATIRITMISKQTTSKCSACFPKKALTNVPSKDAFIDDTLRELYRLLKETEEQPDDHN